MDRLALSVNEAAEMVSLSPWTIRAWIRKGKLPATRLGRRVVVTPEALRKLVQDGTQQNDSKEAK